MVSNVSYVLENKVTKGEGKTDIHTKREREKYLPIFHLLVTA